VGALGLFADGMQGQAPHQVLEPPVVGAQGSPHLEPWGLPRRVVVFRALRRPLAQDRLLGHGVQGQKRQLAFHAHHSYRCLRPAQRRAAGGRRQYRAVSGPKPSRRRLTLCRNRPTYRPSVTRWSKDRHTFIIERMPMASPTTTGRRTMASIVMMAAWGGLMLGYDATEPKAPVLLTVMVAPYTSSRVSLPARARPTRSAKVRAIPAMLRRSASRMTGTTSPSSSPTATPMWIRFFTTIRSSCQLALRRGNSFRLSTTALMKKGTYVRSTPSRRRNSSFIPSRRATSRVTSTSIMVQAWGIACLLWAMRCAMARRIPSAGIISSSAPAGAAAAGANAGAAAAGPAATAAGAGAAAPWPGAAPP